MGDDNNRPRGCIFSKRFPLYMGSHGGTQRGRSTGTDVTEAREENFSDTHLHQKSYFTIRLVR